MLSIVLASCSAVSPRPDTTSTAPPVPEGTVRLGSVTWETVPIPNAIADEAIINDAAARPNGFVLVGDSGAPQFHGSVLTSTDGRAWVVVDDAEVGKWSFEKVIATDDGYVAVGGRLVEPGPDGSASWVSALLTSRDGSAWTVRGSYEGVTLVSVAALGPTVIALSDQSTLLASHDDGQTWKIERTSNLGFDGSPTVVRVLASGRWIAIGKRDASAAAWFSEDGLSWRSATIEAADPVPGIKAVEPDDIAVGSFGAVAAGTEVPDRCEDGDDFCGRFGTGWSTADGTHWMRLPRGTPLTEGWGIRVWPAGASGVLANLPNLAQSPTGWTWSPVAGTSDDMLIDTLVLRGDSIVAAGTAPGADPSAPPERRFRFGQVGHG